MSDDGDEDAGDCALDGTAVLGDAVANGADEPSAVFVRTGVGVSVVPSPLVALELGAMVESVPGAVPVELGVPDAAIGDKCSGGDGVVEVAGLVDAISDPGVSSAGTVDTLAGSGDAIRGLL